MPIKRIKRAFKKVTKPIAKVLNKVVPNEIKPFLPYAAAVAPYLLPPGTAGTGLLGTMKGRAFLSGGLNLASQLAQEGNEEGDFSALSLGLAGLQGALTAPGAAETLRGMQVADTYNPELARFGKPELVGEQLSFLDKARNVGLGALEKGATFAEGITETLQDPFSASLGEFGKAAVVPFSQGSMDLGMATARKALRDYELELDAFNAQAGANQAASDADRRAHIIASMTRANFTQDIIDETLDQLGLLLKDGGIARLGFDNGGTPVFTKGSILKDKDVMRMFEDADQIKSTLSAFIEEERAPNVSEIMDTMKFFEKVGKRYDKTGEKIASREDFEEIDPYGTFVRDEKGFLKRDEEGNFITDKSKINPRRREPVEILMGELIMKKKEKEIDELDKKLIKMLKDKGLLEKFYEDQDKAFRIMDLTEKYKNKQLAKQADADSMLGAFGYGEINKANGGIARLGFYNGGDVSFGGITEAVKNVEQKPRKFLVDKLEVTQEPGQSEMRAIIEAMYNDIDDVMPEDRKREFYQLYAPQMLQKGEMDETEFKFIQTEILGKKMKKGGIASLKDGGIMDLGGKEMDMRTGGFIPIGAKERADDVPARLSKNEFVMTADAVRAAGGGSVNKGAKRMYDLMHNLEARA
jgi:hypothetical protein